MNIYISFMPHWPVKTLYWVWQLVIVQLVCHVPFLWDGFSRTLEIKTSTHDVTSTQNYTAAPKNSTIDWAEHNQWQYAIV